MRLENCIPRWRGLKARRVVTIRNHLDGILVWPTLRTRHADLEGMNNKVKPADHRSYDFRDDRRYIQAIYHYCGKLPLPEC